MIEGSVTRTDLYLQEPIYPLTSGCRNSVFLHLHFSRHWDAYGERWAEFFGRGGERHRIRVSEEGIATFPEEILARGGRIFLSVIGEDKTDGSRVVTEKASLYVTGGDYSGEEG